MITVRDGFLLLNRATDGKIESVKGSAVTRVAIGKTESLPSIECTFVTIGCNGWSIAGTEFPDEIIEAVARAYQQAARR